MSRHDILVVGIVTLAVALFVLCYALIQEKAASVPIRVSSIQGNPDEKLATLVAKIFCSNEAAV